MSKFNLRDYQKIDGNIPIDKRLEEDRGNIPNEINESQLKNYRSENVHKTIEGLLNEVQTGESTVITERGLDTKKSNFGIEYRNSDAFTGNINKLEEQRLANDPVEDEKYKPNSGAPKKFRWWEDDDSPDGLDFVRDTKDSKKSKKKVATAQSSLIDDLDPVEIEEEIIPPEWSAVNDESYEDDDDFEIEDASEMDETFESMGIVDSKFISGDIPGIYITLEYDTTEFDGSLDAVKNKAYDVVISENPELSGLISPDDFSSPQESGRVGTLFLRAAGDQFRAMIPSEEDEVSDIDSSDGSVDELNFYEQDLGGTSMAGGKVKTSEIVNDDNIADVVDKMIKYVNNKHKNVNLTEDSIDKVDIENGIISYITPIISEASSDFPIIEAQSKKKVMTKKK